MTVWYNPWSSCAVTLNLMYTLLGLQLNDAQKRFESVMREPHGAHVASNGVQQKQHRVQQQVCILMMHC